MTKEILPEGGDSPDNGDFAEDSDEADEISWDCEPYDRYDEGLYYPVCIGEVLAGRYRIDHKLGWGGFSTVWMAHDMQDRKDVALKIGIPGEDGENEYRMQEEIIRTVRDTSHLLIYQGTFLLPGRDGGHHRVFVLPLLGPSLNVRLREPPMTTRMSAAKQVLVALKGLHEVGLVHRDINEGCVMWEISSSFAEHDKATKYKLLGRPKKVALDELWKTGELVLPLTMPLDLLGGKVYLGDFGLTFKDGTPVETKVHGPYRLCAPERYHGTDPSLASDVWSYMCLFVVLYANCNVFTGQGGNRTGDSWYERLGGMPEHWKGKFWDAEEARDYWYDPKAVPHPDMTIEGFIARCRPEVSEAERELFVSLMRKAFCYLPENRITVAQLLEDPSFKALMEIYQC